jgi:hypothetical protein
MPPKVRYKVLQGTAPAIQTELNQLNIDASWRPILMTSTACADGANLCVIVEHVIGT